MMWGLVWVCALVRGQANVVSTLLPVFDPVNGHVDFHVVAEFENLGNNTGFGFYEVRLMSTTSINRTSLLASISSNSANYNMTITDQDDNTVAIGTWNIFFKKETITTRAGKTNEFLKTGITIDGTTYFFSTFKYPLCSYDAAFISTGTNEPSFGMGSGGIILCDEVTLKRPDIVGTMVLPIQTKVERTALTTIISTDGVLTNADVDISRNPSGFYTLLVYGNQTLIDSIEIQAGYFRPLTTIDGYNLEPSLRNEIVTKTTVTNGMLKYANYTSGTYEYSVFNCDGPCENHNGKQFNIQPDTFLNNICRACFCINNFAFCSMYTVPTQQVLRTKAVAIHNGVSGKQSIQATATQRVPFRMKDLSTLQFGGSANCITSAEKVDIYDAPLPQGCPTTLQIAGYARPFIASCAPTSDTLNVYSPTSVLPSMSQKFGYSGNLTNSFVIKNPSPPSENVAAISRVRCASNSTYSVNLNGTCKPCSVVPSGYYQTAACTFTSDTLTRPVSSCPECIHILETPTSDRTCGQNIDSCLPGTAKRRNFTDGCQHCTPCSHPNTGYTAAEVARCAATKFLLQRPIKVTSSETTVEQACSSPSTGSCVSKSAVIQQANQHLAQQNLPITVVGNDDNRNSGNNYVSIAPTAATSDAAPDIPSGLRCPRGQYLNDTDNIPQCIKVRQCYYYEKQATEISDAVCAPYTGASFVVQLIWVLAGLSYSATLVFKVVVPAMRVYKK